MKKERSFLMSPLSLLVTFLLTIKGLAYEDSRDYARFYSPPESAKSVLDSMTDMGLDVLVLGEFHYQIKLIELAELISEIVLIRPEYNCLYVEQTQEWVSEISESLGPFRNNGPDVGSLPTNIQMAYYAYLIFMLEDRMKIIGVDTDRQGIFNGTPSEIDFNTYARRNKNMAAQIALNKKTNCNKGFLLTGRDHNIAYRNDGTEDYSNRKSVTDFLEESKLSTGSIRLLYSQIILPAPYFDIVLSSFSHDEFAVCSERALFSHAPEKSLGFFHTGRNTITIERNSLGEKWTPLELTPGYLDYDSSILFSPFYLARVCAERYGDAEDEIERYVLNKLNQIRRSRF